MCKNFMENDCEEELAGDYSDTDCLLTANERKQCTQSTQTDAIQATAKVTINDRKQSKRTLNTKEVVEPSTKRIKKNECLIEEYNKPTEFSKIDDKYIFKLSGVQVILI